MKQIEIVNHKMYLDFSHLNQPAFSTSELVYIHLCLRCSNAVLLAENDMFARFLCRMDQLDPQAAASGSLGPGSVFVSPQMRGKRQSSRSLTSDGLQELTLEQKLYVVQREVAETKQEQTRVQQRYEKIQDDHKVHTFEDTHEFEFHGMRVRPQRWLCHLQASMKEAEIRLEEIRKAKNAFERKLHAHMTDHRLEKREPEKLLKYIEDKSKVNLCTTIQLI